MQKYLIFILSLFIVLIQSCKKEAPSNGDDTPVYLISTITTRYESGPDVINTYTYDAANRLTNLTITRSYSYQYSYSADGKLSSYQATSLGLDDNYVATYTYSGNTINIVKKYEGGYEQKQVMKLSNGRIIQNTLLGSKYDITANYTYDGSGNIVGYDLDDSVLGLVEAGSIKYDTNKSPFTMVKGYNAVLFNLSVLGAFGVNNVVDLNGNKTTYVYDAAGYPTSASATAGSGTKSTMVYTYISK